MKFPARPGEDLRVLAPAAACVPRQRLAARGRPYEDPGCAGCAQLGVLRTLRRAGLTLEGGLGCERTARVEPGSAGRSALVVGAASALRDAPGLLAARADRRLLVVADRGGMIRADGVARALGDAGAEVLRLRPDRTEPLERVLRRDAPAARAVAVVSLAPCARSAPRAPPLSVLPSRCSRCGACLGLGCVALSDPGGEAIEISPSLCSGCGRCAPLCRGRAIVPA